MTDTNEWINKKYLDKKHIDKLKKDFKSNKPFPFLDLKDFFNEKKITELKTVCLKEGYELKDSDLFKFLQSNDLKSSKNSVIIGFRNFIVNDFVKYIEILTGIKLKRDAYMHITLYRDTHYLLCHDDQLEDRKLAFMLYLNDLPKKNGGALRLFYQNGKSISIQPKFNSLVFFEVSSKSLHDVQEVINADRLTVAWWYYD